MARAIVERHRSVFTRLATGFNVPQAAQQAESAAKLLAQRIDGAGYLRWLRTELAAITRVVDAFLRLSRRQDAFGVRAALPTLARAAGSASWSNATAAHSSLLNRLDSFVTFLQLERGDPADILQCVRWQERLYTRTAGLQRLEGAAKVRRASRAFIESMGQRGIGSDQYPGLIKELLDSYRQTAAALPRLGLAKLILEMTRQMEDRRPSRRRVATI